MNGSAGVWGQPLPFLLGQVRRLVDQILAGDPDARIVVAGDFNATPEEVPVLAIRGNVEDGLHLPVQAHPDRLRLLRDSCPSGQRFASGFLAEGVGKICNACTEHGLAIRVDVDSPQFVRLSVSDPATGRTASRDLGFDRAVFAQMLSALDLYPDSEFLAYGLIVPEAHLLRSRLGVAPPEGVAELGFWR